MSNFSFGMEQTEVFPSFDSRFSLPICSPFVRVTGRQRSDRIQREFPAPFLIAYRILQSFRRLCVIIVLY